MAAAYPHCDIKAMRQPGKGKADAIFAGFEAARGDVLIILDADLSVPPEQLPKFWEAIRSGKAEFVNGSRLVYPMEHQAMRFLNLVANKAFSLLFTWLLSQRFTDTLCGTKALRRSDYARLKAGRSYFGDFDPFGDFALIFGASKLGLKAVEIPIRYASRTYGETRFRACGTASCCCAWSSSRSCASRRCDERHDPLLKTTGAYGIASRSCVPSTTTSTIESPQTAGPGLTIEIGGGIGNLKQRLADVITTDIQSAPWLDCVADAQQLPFAADSAANIVMVDVLASSRISGRLLP